MDPTSAQCFLKYDCISLFYFFTLDSLIIDFIDTDFSIGYWNISFWDCPDTPISTTLAFHSASSHCDGNCNTSDNVSTYEKEPYYLVFDRLYFSGKNKGIKLLNIMS